MPFTFTLDAVPIGWAELLVVELEANPARHYSAIGWGELHSYQPFEKLRSLLLINRAARSGPPGHVRARLRGIGKLELFGPSNTPIPARQISLEEIRSGSYFVAYVAFASEAATVAGAIPAIPRTGLNAEKIPRPGTPHPSTSPTEDDRAAD